MVSQHALQVSRPIPRGGVEGSGQGGAPGPHLGVSQHALRLLLWAVRILLEFILVTVGCLSTTNEMNCNISKIRM